MENHEFDLILKMREKVRPRFQTLWLKEGAERQRLTHSLSRYATLPCEVEISLAGRVRWQQVSTPQGARLHLWPANALHESRFTWTRWPLESEAVLRGITSVAPKDNPTPATHDAFRRFSREILAAAAGSCAGLCRELAASAWKTSTEHSPLLEIPLAEGASPADILERLSKGLRSPGFAGALSAALKGPLDIEIHLPPLTRAWTRRALERLEAGRLTTGAGWVRVQGDDPGEEQAMQAAAASMLAARRELPVRSLLRFDHTRCMTAAQAAFTLPFLLRRYGLEDWGRDWLDGRTGPVTVRAALSLPAAATAAWPLMPGERQAAFYDVFVHACKALHDAMRQWAPYLYFSTPERFADFETSQAALAFSLTRTIHTKGSRTLFTFDLLDPDHMTRAVGRMAEPLGRLYAGVRKRLTEEGMEELASRYTFRAANDTIQQARDLVNRAFGRLLQSESQITHAFMAFAVQGPKMWDQRGLAFSAAAELAGTIDPRLRWLLAEEPAPPLTPLFLIEATRALWSAQGHPAAIPVRIGLSAEGSPETIAEAEVGDAEPAGAGEPAGRD